MASCDVANIRAALFEEAALTTDISTEKVGKSDRMVLAKIPDQGVAGRHENHSAIIMGEAGQAGVAYRQENYAVRPLVAGNMNARTNSGQNGIFDTDINDIDDNNCRGATVIDFAQGFRRRDPIPFRAGFETPVKCVRDFDRFDKRYIRAYFEGMRNFFSNFGVDNFAENLLNMVIRYGQANASVIAGGRFEMTEGGWAAPPAKRITIDFLQQYRRRIMQLKRNFGQEVPQDYLLEVEMPEEDVVDAIIKDSLVRNPTGTVYNTNILTDELGKLRGRRYTIYGGIKFYFNDTPIRGYFRQSGTGVYRFVRVLDWVNEVDEEGGVVKRFNFQYDNDTFTDDGVSYPMVTLIPHIDPTSFKRWGLEKPLKPIGDANESVNYTVKVIDGAFIDCNEDNDKFKLRGRHEFLWLAKYPELSGMIAYRHGRRASYDFDVVPRTDIENATATAFEPVLREQDIDACSQATCAQCDQVADDDLQCVDPGAISNSILTLAPAVTGTAYVPGVNTNVVLEVLRSNLTGGPVTVAYATSNGTASSGSDYTAVSGTLTWEAGDGTPKYITVPFLAAATDGQNMSVTISSPTGATIASGANTVLLTIETGA